MNVRKKIIICSKRSTYACLSNLHVPIQLEQDKNFLSEKGAWLAESLKEVDIGLEQVKLVELQVTRQRCRLLATVFMHERHMSANLTEFLFCIKTIKCLPRRKFRRLCTGRATFADDTRKMHQCWKARRAITMFTSTFFAVFLPSGLFFTLFTKQISFL